MTMDAKVYEVLKASLADKKIEKDGKELPLIDLVSGWHDVIEVSDKIKKANEDLSNERKQLQEDIKASREAIKKAEQEVERYRKGALTDDDKKSFEAWKSKGMTGEAEAKFNALQDQLKTMIAEHTTLKNQFQEKEELVQKTTREKMEADLKADLLNKLAEKKISGKNARLALAAILSEGLAKYNEKGERVYTIVKDGKILASDIDGLVNDFASQNENLIESSGNRGTGNEPGLPTNRHTTTTDKGMSLDQIRNSARDMLSLKP